MVRALDRKLLRDLGHLKGQVLTIALVVAAGFTAFAGVRSAYSALERSRDAFYERYHFADVFARLKRAPQPLESRIERLPGVAQVHTRVVEEVMMPMPGRVEPATGRIISLPPGGRPPLNDIHLSSGRMPEPDRPGEVVVLGAFARAHGLSLGAELSAVINGALRKLRVVGTGLSPEYVLAINVGDVAPDDRGFAVLWMDREQLSAMLEMEGAFNDVVIRTQPGADDAGVAEALDRLLGPYGSASVVVRERQLSHFVLSGELAQLAQYALVIPAIFLGVAAFLLNVVLSRLVHLQRSQIAALKALGYADRQIGLHYFEFVTVIVFIGCAIGYLGARPLAGFLLGIYARFFHFPTLARGLAGSTVVWGIVISFAAALLGALTAVRAVVRLPPAEAMRPAAPGRYRRTALDRQVIARALGQSGTMVARELRRRPLRTLLSSLGVAAAVGVVIVGRSGYDSFDRLVSDIYQRELAGDIEVTFTDEMPESVLPSLAAVPGVLAAEGLRQVPVRFRHGARWRDSAILALPADADLRQVIDRGGDQVDIGPDGLSVSRKLAEVLQLRPGDLVTVEVKVGDREQLHLPVVALIDDAFGIQGYAQTGYLHAVLREAPSVTGANLRVSADRALTIERRLEDMPQVAGFSRKQAVIDRFRQQTGETMYITTLILTGFGIVIAVGVVYNNARVALSMRGHELATLRVLGFTRAEISAVLLGEMAVHVLVALPIGLLLGRWWSAAILAGVDPETYRIPLHISPVSHALAVAVILGASLLSALLVRRRLDHLDLISVLKARE